MRVLITGGTGFVGRGITQELLNSGHEVELLVRPGSEGKVPDSQGPYRKVRVRPGDVLDPPSLLAAIRGCDAVIHLVGIIREFPKNGITFERLHTQASFNVISAIKTVGPRRYLHMSALGAAGDSPSPYHRTKAEAEAGVRVAGLDWTIFRPSLIYGPGDLSLNMFAAQIRKLPLVPVIGNGRYLLQPISLQTVAQAFCAALEKGVSVGQAYSLTGPQAYTYNDLLRVLGRVMDRRVRLVHLPVWPVRLATRLLGRFPSFPLTTTQLAMLLQGNAGDGTQAHQDLGLDPVPLEEGLAAYLKG
jgi:uncharacterized protein YbjT (DUF2867 family)